MAKKTIEINKLSSISVINQKVQGVSKPLGHESFDVVVVNPPYSTASEKEIESFNSATLKGKERSNLIAKTEVLLSSSELCQEITKLLKFAGSCYIVIPAFRVSEYIFNLENNNLKVKKIKFVFNEDNSARLALIKASKGANNFCRVEK